jgi:hypothetical protein
MKENGGAVNKFENNIKTIIKEEEQYQDQTQEEEEEQEQYNKEEMKKIKKSPKNKNIINDEKIYDEEQNDEDKNELINMNKELISKITLLKKEVEYSKNEMKKKDEKILRYLNRFDKIASENAYNNAEILNLEEELMNRKNEMDMKTQKINELMNINMGLEQEMNQLKIYYKSKENKKSKNDNSNSFENNYINSNEPENKDKNSINEDFNNEEMNEEKNNEYGNQYESNNNEEMENQYNIGELIDELHSRRNNLIKERNEITVLYNKLPINIVDKEQIEQKAELENRLAKINKDLVKIRLQLKNISE